MLLRNSSSHNEKALKYLANKDISPAGEKLAVATYGEGKLA